MLIPRVYRLRAFGTIVSLENGSVAHDGGGCVPGQIHSQDSLQEKFTHGDDQPGIRYRARP